MYASRHLTVVGTNHKHSHISIRERLSCGNGFLNERLKAVIRSHDDISEVIILSTCNRTEVYTISSRDSNIPFHLTNLMSTWSQISATELRRQVYTFLDVDAVKHLFMVASGLDSLVLGEQQIQEQVKLAAGEASGAGTCGRFLAELFQYAYRTATKVRKETDLGLENGSVSSAAISLLKEISERSPIQSILLIGAGKMMKLATRDVASLANSVWVANRTPERAILLAERFQGTFLPFDEIQESLHKFDVVLSFTSSQNYIISRRDVGAAMERRNNRKLFIIDASIPRNVEPESKNIPGVELYNVDDLAAYVTYETEFTERVQNAKHFIDREVDHFCSRVRIYNVDDTLKELWKMAEAIRESELSRAIQRMGKPSNRDREVMDLLTKRIINKLLHQPTTKLKEHASNGDGESYEAVIRDLFAMGQEKQR